jgi:hypothetical protein
MMMTHTSPLPVTLAGRTLEDELRVRFENVKTLGLNFSKSVVQDTNTFKIGSALIASFALVLARVGIATQSAKKEAQISGPDSEATAFSKDQALMTAVREMGGFLTSWLFMSLFNIAMDKPSQLLFGVRINKHGVTGPVTFISKLAQQLVPWGNRVLEERLPIAVGSKQTLHVLGYPTTFNHKNPSPMEAYFSTLKPTKINLFARKALELLVNQPQLKQELAVDAASKTLSPTASLQEKADVLLALDEATLHKTTQTLDPALYNTALIQRGFTNFRTYVVPAVGAVISTIVAGWMLERATLLHFPEIIDKINKLRPKKQSLKKTLPADQQPEAPLGLHYQQAVPIVEASSSAGVNPLAFQQLGRGASFGGLPTVMIRRGMWGG